VEADYNIFHISSSFYSRWKRTSGGVMLEGGKKVLEFVAIQRRDNSQWAIPGVISLNYCKSGW